MNFFNNNFHIKNWKFLTATFFLLIGLGGWQLGFLDFIPKLSTPFGDFVVDQNTTAAIATNVATTTINIADVIKRIQNSKTSKEAEEFLELYKDTLVVGTGKFSNEWKASDNEGPRIGVTVANRTVQCNFGPEWNKKIQLHELGDQISFSGIFRFIEFRGFYYVDECILVK